MKMKLFTFLILGISLSICLGQAPKIFWGAPFRQSRINGPSKLVAQDKYGYYSLNSNSMYYNTGVTLHKYDNEFQEVGKLEFNTSQSGKMTTLAKVLGLPQSLSLLMITNDMRKKEKHLYVQNVNTQTFRLEKDKKELLKIDYTGIPYDKAGSFSYSVSSDRSKILVATDLPSKHLRNPDSLCFTVFSNDFTQIWTQSHKFPYPDRDFTTYSYEVDNEGNVYCIGLNRETYHILCISPKYEKPLDIPILIQNHLIADLQLTFAGNGDIVCSGFYSDKDISHVEGVFSLIIDGITKQVKVQDFAPIPLETIVENESEDKQKRMEKQEKNGKNVELYDYDLRAIVHKSNNSGYTLVGEQFYVKTYSYYDNNTKTWRTQNVYHHNDIIVVSINEKGKIEWAKKIGKHQKSHNNGTYLLYMIIFCKKKKRLILVLPSTQNKPNEFQEIRIKYSLFF